MTRAFADTSAFYALLVSTDANHARAARTFQLLADSEAALLTTSYVLVETYALLQRRVGPGAVSAFRSDLAPLLDVVWVDAALHDLGLDWLFERGGGSVSLVDGTSFVVIRQQRIEDVFAYDRHFSAEGFHLL